MTHSAPRALVLAALALAWTPACGGSAEDSCPAVVPGNGTACANSGQTCGYAGTTCNPGAEAICADDGTWQVNRGASGCDPWPPSDPPPPKATCPLGLPVDGAVCASALSCDYTAHAGECGYVAVNATCDGESWAAPDPSASCTPVSPQCDPVGSWKLTFDTTSEISFGGCSLPDDTLKVTESDGAVRVSWGGDPQHHTLGTDGCTLSAEYTYAYSGEESGGEWHALTLEFAGDEATGTYKCEGDGFSAGTAQGTVTAKRF